jgi:hypothetical protein
LPDGITNTFSNLLEISLIKCKWPRWIGSKVPPTMAKLLFIEAITNPGQYEELGKVISSGLQRLKDQRLQVRLAAHVGFH